MNKQPITAEQVKEISKMLKEKGIKLIDVNGEEVFILRKAPDDEPEYTEYNGFIYCTDEGFRQYMKDMQSYSYPVEDEIEHKIAIRKARLREAQEFASNPLVNGCKTVCDLVEYIAKISRLISDAYLTGDISADFVTFTNEVTITKVEYDRLKRIESDNAVQ